MKPLSPEASALIRTARGADDPDRHAHARVRRALAASSAAGVTSLAVTTVAASLATGLGAAAGGAKPLLAVVLYLALGGLAGGGVSVVVHEAFDEPLPVSSSPTTGAERAGPEVALRSSLPAPSSTASAAPLNVVSAVAPPSLPKEIASSLEAEARRLGAAERALRQGELAEARRQLDAYDREFGAGALRQEAEGARVVLACQGSDPAGAALAEAFARRFPGSPLLPRVRGVCPNEASGGR